jgi:signal transduction histidine kinase
VPVVAIDGRVLGVLHLENKKGSTKAEGFDHPDEEMLRYVAQQVAIAIEKVGLYRLADKWVREGLEDDLHELINWYHAGVVLWLESMKADVTQGNIEKAISPLPNLIRRAYATLYELKNIHTAIVSRYFEEEGVEAALRLVESTLRIRTGFKKPIILEIDDEIALSTPVKNKLLRIAIGAMTNAIVHSGVDRHRGGQIWIRLTKVDEQVVLEVEDNGRGMKQSLAEGYGIVRMRQLAKQLKCDLEIESESGKGTRIRVEGVPEVESL